MSGRTVRDLVARLAGPAVTDPGHRRRARQQRGGPQYRWPKAAMTGPDNSRAMGRRVTQSPDRAAKIQTRMASMDTDNALTDAR